MDRPGGAPGGSPHRRRERAEQVDDSITLLRAFYWSVGICSARGELATAVEYAERGIALAERMGNPFRLASALETLAMASFVRGDWDGTERSAHRALAVAPSPWAGDAQPTLAELALVRGKWDEASSHIEEVATNLERMGRLADRVTRLLLAEKDLAQGCAASAVAGLEPVSADSQATYREQQALAQACLEVGKIAEADEIVAMGLERSRAVGLRLALVEWLPLKGLMEMQRGHWDQAAVAFEEARSLAQMIGCPYGEARALYELGTMCSERSESRQAEAKLEEALSIFRRLGATPDIERTRAALAAIPRSVSG